MTFDVAALKDRLQAALGPNYRLERTLGQGGMGVVYLATDINLDRPVAVKVVHPELAVHNSIAQRFLSEARVIARLRHPNIVAIHAAGETAGVFWYVMDYVPGETLRDRLNRDGTVDPATTRRILSELAGALDAAGRQGVVHRDVKPENILIDAEGGRALLVDFGVARILQGGGEGQTNITGQGVAVGTPTYMSPEQAASDDLDGRSDLYALGIVGYEMLTGQPPFRGSPAQVAAQQIQVTPAPLGRLLPQVPPALSAAIMRALAKSPAARFQSGAEFREALLADVAAPARRIGWRAWAAAAVVVVMTAGLVFAARGSGGPPRGVDPRHSIVVLPFDNLRGDTTLHWLEEGAVSMLGLTLAQWKDLTVVDQERVHDLLTKRGLEPGAPIGLEAARAIAREAGVWSLVVGDFVRTGDSLHVAARLIDVTSGQRVDLAQADVLALGDIRPAFDRLAAQLLDVSGAPDGLRAGLAATTTGSVDAYRQYLVGIERLNRWDLVSADSVLRTAVRMDSTFALAWFKLSLARGWIGGEGDSVGRQAIDQAVRYVDRLPPREQGLVQAYRAFIDGELPRAIGLYTALVQKDSTDTDAWYGLGDAWYHRPAQGVPERIRTMNASLRAFRRTLALDPTYALAYDHLAAMFLQTARPHPYFALAGTDSFALATDMDQRARAAAIARARREGIALTRNWVVSQPETPRAHRALVEAYAVAGAVNEAERELTRLAGMGYPKEPVITQITEGRIRFGAGDVHAAANELAALYDSLLADRARLARAVTEDWGAVEAGLNALAYVGDVGRAARVLNGVQRARGEIPKNPELPFDPRLQAEMQVGALYAATGGAPDPLRTVWRSVTESARRAPSGERAAIARAGTPAAVGLLLGPAHDATPLNELRALTGEEPPRDVRALLLISSGDTAAARQLLTAPTEVWAEEKRGALGAWASEPWPLRAYGLLQLHENQRALDLLERYDPDMLDPRGYSTTFAASGMIRLLRGMALER
ncbi:MAG TPA: serine/threonine-protein kinase, partial [Gemmatimonadales bacterium]|nr:serine/threonine-protein kinase [Gemmatimonadales bacterium]